MAVGWFPVVMGGVAVAVGGSGVALGTCVSVGVRVAVGVKVGVAVGVAVAVGVGVGVGTWMFKCSFLEVWNPFALSIYRRSVMCPVGTSFMSQVYSLSTCFTGVVVRSIKVFHS